MKKTVSLILTVCLMLALTVTALAAVQGSVTELTAAASSGIISISGKTDGDVKAAVAVQILDASGNVVGMESFVVSSENTFAGTIVYSAGSTPTTARAADFDGGDWKTVAVTTTGGNYRGGGTAAVEAAKTGDMGAMLYGVIALTSALGSAALVGKKREA